MRGNTRTMITIPNHSCHLGALGRPLKGLLKTGYLQGIS